MGLMARPTKAYWRPEEGEYPAQIVDIVDLGIVESNFEGRISWPHKIILVTEIDAREAPTKDRCCILEWLTLSTHEMSKLRPIIEDIMDREITDEEYENGFPIEDLIGKKLTVKIVDRATGIGPKRKVRSSIRRRQPATKGFKSTYVRSKYLQKLEDEAVHEMDPDDVSKNLGF